jgi:hypothetical protein
VSVESRCSGIKSVLSLKGFYHLEPCTLNRSTCSISILKRSKLISPFIVLIIVRAFGPVITGHGHGLVDGINDILVLGIQKVVENR